jgi:hypothetical protein
MVCLEKNLFLQNGIDLLTKRSSLESIRSGEWKLSRWAEWNLISLFYNKAGGHLEI